MSARKHTLESLLAKTVEEGQCLLWQGLIDCHGVPKVNHECKKQGVRKVILEFMGKKVPQGHFLVASCGNRACVCPEHVTMLTPKQHAALRGGSKRKNYAVARANMAAAARQRQGKLTMEKAREIRLRTEPAPKIAGEYGVHKSLINAIRRGVAWREYSADPFAGLGARA